MTKRFEGRTVMITGATSGIGAATAVRFAAEGAKTVLVGRNENKGNEIVDLITDSSGNAEFIKCDITEEDDVEVLRKYLEEENEKIDVLFNNAGIMLSSSEIERMSVMDWDSTFNTNIRGMFLVTRACKQFIQGGGSIINNASIAGLQYYAAGRSYAYSASKAAVIQFTHLMAKNYGEEGIRVNCICPGIIDTAILGDRDRKEYGKRVPLGYVGTPEEVASVVAFLASDEASYVTGAILTIDGGASL